MAKALTEAATRDRILSAAVDVFARQGYHGTGVEDIVQASNTSKGAFYHYFPSKQSIFLTVMDELAALVEHGVEEAISSEQGALAKVEAALGVVIETAAQQRDLAKILLVEAVGLGPELEKKRLAIHSRFAGLIRRHLDRAIEERSLPAQDTRLASLAWIGAINEIISQWLVSGGEVPRSSELRSLLLRSIGADRG